MSDWDFIKPKTPAPLKLMIYDGTPPPDGMIALRLISVGPNEVILAAVDGAGDCLLDVDSDDYAGSLLTVTDKHVIPSLNVMPSLGFELDVHGCVLSDPELEALKAKRSKNFGGKRAAFRAVD